MQVVQTFFFCNAPKVLLSDLGSGGDSYARFRTQDGEVYEQETHGKR